jgi:hypothetical protein
MELEGVVWRRFRAHFFLKPNATQSIVAKIPMAETVQAENAAFSRMVKRVFGLDLHSWEQVMLLSLGVAALAAVAVVVATAIVVRLQKVESNTSRHELELYKAEAGEKIAAAEAVGKTAQAEIAKANAQIAEANARTAAAEIQLQEMRQKVGPRRIDEKIFLARLEGAPKKTVLVSHAEDDPDSYFLANSLLGLLNAAKWDARYVEVTAPNVKTCVSSFGGVTVLTKRISEEEGEDLMNKPPKERVNTPFLTLTDALTDSLQGHNVFLVTCPSLPEDVLQVAVSPRFVFFPKQ